SWWWPRSSRFSSSNSQGLMRRHAEFADSVLRGPEVKHRPHHRPPLSFRAWEAVNTLKADLAYRTPKGRPMKHVVLRRDLAVALLATVRRHYALTGAPI